MIYNDFQDLKLSALGFGAMRLPIINNVGANIDEEKAAEMIAYALEKGINYFDTAYGYHDGMSEIVMGKLLSAYPRKTYYLASKFPGYDLNNMNKVEEIFEEQLKKCGVDYFDFYLLHNIYEKNIDPYLDPQYGIMEYLLAQKANGRIKHLGFSVHGRYETIKKFLDAHGKDMEFCQVQLNYLDWTLQNAKAKVELLNSYNIPIWVMEPLRGGKLANLSEENIEKFKAIRPDETPVSVAFRFLQSLPTVTVSLSGMSTMEQLQKNIETFETFAPLNESELEVAFDVANSMLDGVPCTACRYCTASCPAGLDIPVLLSLYNDAKFINSIIAHMSVAAFPKDKRPSACIACKACEKVCPQQIEIADTMAAFVERLKQPAGL